MPDYPRPRRILTREGTEAIEAPYVPELSPVTDRQALLMTRPWLEWCRHVAGFIQHGGGSGGGGGTGTGDVVGPPVATNDAIAIYNGTTGKIIKDSLKTIAGLTTDITNSILPGGTLPLGDLSLHHATHEVGGVDELVNAAWTNRANVFTQDQTISKHTPWLILHDTNGPVDQKRLVIESRQQLLTVYAATDAGTIDRELFLVDQNGNAFLPAGGLTVFGAVTAPAGLDGTPLNASQLTSGTVPDARLSANVQMKPIAAADLPAHGARHQPGGADAMAVDAAAATGSLRTLGSGATQAAAGNDARLTDARTPTAHQSTHRSGGSDPLPVTALAGYPGGTVNFLRADGTFAAPPSAAAVVWTDVTFNAANFSVVGASWPVTVGQVLLNHYRLVGKSLLWVIILSAAGPVTGGTQLVLVPPVLGTKNLDGAVRPGMLKDASGRPDVWAYVSTAHSGVVVEKYNTGIAYSGSIDLHLSIEFEVA